jgi:hypothetical protein
MEPQIFRTIIPRIFANPVRKPRSGNEIPPPRRIRRRFCSAGVSPALFFAVAKGKTAGGDAGATDARHAVRSASLQRFCVANPGKNQLFVAEQSLEVGDHFGAGPILRADDFAIDAALAIDDVSFGVHRGAVGNCDLFRRVAICGEADVI